MLQKQKGSLGGVLSYKAIEITPWLSSHLPDLFMINAVIECSEFKISSPSHGRQYILVRQNSKFTVVVHAMGPLSCANFAMIGEGGMGNFKNLVKITVFQRYLPWSGDNIYRSR